MSENIGQPLPLPLGPEVHVFHPAREAPSITSAYAWIIALLPLVGAVIEFGLELGGGGNTSATQNTINIVYTVLIFVSIKIDRSNLIAAGYSNAPSAWWTLLSPVYLWKRATVLRQSRRPFWIQIGSSAAMGMLVVVGSLMQADALFKCGDIDSSQVVQLFNNLSVVRQAAIDGVSLSDTEQTYDGPDKRICAAVITASNGDRYKVFYDLYLKDGQNRINVRSK